MLYYLTYFLYYLKTHKFILDYDKQEHPLCPTLLLWACNSSTGSSGVNKLLRDAFSSEKLSCVSWSFQWFMFLKK